MTVYTIRAERLPEAAGAGRLGRHVRHDSRSRGYPWRPPARAEVRDVLHARHAPILDQGGLSSCTGNAAAGALATSPVWDALPAVHPAMDEDEAVALYSAATALDDYPGAFPPDDTGSDGLAVCKAMTAAGLISGYQWAFSLADALAALAERPLLLGTGWYDSMDAPDAAGRVTISPGAALRGGHEYLARQIVAAERLVGCDNSWGLGWGAAGRFFLSFDDLGRLLAEQGDAAVPVPAALPAPVPAPVPDVRADDADRKARAAMDAWADGRRLWPTCRNAASAYRSWRKAKWP